MKLLVRVFKHCKWHPPLPINASPLSHREHCLSKWSSRHHHNTYSKHPWRAKNGLICIGASPARWCEVWRGKEEESSWGKPLWEVFAAYIEVQLAGCAIGLPEWPTTPCESSIVTSLIGTKSISANVPFSYLATASIFGSIRETFKEISLRNDIGLVELRVTVGKRCVYLLYPTYPCTVVPFN